MDRPLGGGGWDRGELVVGGGQGRRGLLVICSRLLRYRSLRRGRDGGCLCRGLTWLLLGSLRRLYARQQQWEKGGHGGIALAIPDSISFAATHNHGNPPSLDLIRVTEPRL